MGETTFILIILMSGIFSTMEEDMLTLLIADYAKCRWQMFVEIYWYMYKKTLENIQG